MQLSIISPEKTLYSADIAMVTAPGVEGEFGVLPGHAPFISALRPGIITVDADDGSQTKIAVCGGFTEVAPEHCTILAENATNISEMSDAEKSAMRDKLAAAEEKLEIARRDNNPHMEADARLAILLLELVIAELHPLS